MNSERGAYYREMREKLGQMKSLFGNQPEADGYKRHFEESVAANELEVALHSLCDFLFEPSTRPVSEATVNEIANFHAAMGIEDACSSKLRAKASAAA